MVAAAPNLICCDEMAAVNGKPALKKPPINLLITIKANQSRISVDQRVISLLIRCFSSCRYLRMGKEAE